MAIGEDRLSYEINEHCLIREVDIVLPGGKQKSLGIDYSPVTDDDDVIQKMLISVRDITKRRHAELKMKESQEELSMIREILSCPPELFQDFMRTSDEYLRELRYVLDQEDPESVIEKSFLIIHTIKGAARTMGFGKISGLMHKIEDQLADAKGVMDAREKAELLGQISDVAKELDKYSTIASDKLNRQVPDLQKDDEESEGDFRIYAGRTVIERALNRIEDIAGGLGKNPPNIDLDICDVGLNLGMARSLREALSHLISNSLDHGIETAEVRRAKGKAANGTIKISLSKVRSRLVFTYEDDGAGLDLARLRDIARERNISGVESWGNQKLAETIFLSGHSTAEKVTEISGRGVGMSAVKKFLEDAGGNLELDLLKENGEGSIAFRLVITFDESCWLDIRSNSKKVA